MSSTSDIDRINAVRRNIEYLSVDDVMDVFAEYILTMQMGVMTELVSDDVSTNPKAVVSPADVVASAQDIADEIISGEFTGTSLKEAIQKVADRRKVSVYVEYVYDNM